MRQCFSIMVVLALACVPVFVSAGFRDDILFEDFEADDGGFMGTIDWEWGDYSWIGGLCDSANYPPPGPYSGNRMWGTVLNDCYQNLSNNSGYDTCVNGNTADDSILSFSVDLTGYTTVTMTFYEWFDLFLAWDWAEIYVNGNVVFQHCGGSFVQPTEWVMQTIDLSPYAGTTATIAFHMMASSVVNHAGWYIDDVRIFSDTTMTPTPNPTEPPTPTPSCLHTGDANQDGDVTAGDAQMAFMIALGLITPTYEEGCAADCNADGDVTAGDAQQIFMMALGTATCADPL